MSAKSIIPAALLLFCNNVAAFDTSAFQTLDDKSEQAAKTFLALPAPEAHKLALEHVQLTDDDQTNYAWQVFLLTYLSNQNLSTAQWKLLEEKSLLAELEGEKYGHRRQIKKQLNKKGDGTGPLCFAQLQITPASKENQEQDESQEEQQNTFRMLQRVCIPELIEIINRKDVFNWYIKAVDEGKYNVYISQLFKQNNLLNRMLLREKQGADFGALSDEQQQQLTNSWLVYFFAEKENPEFSSWNIASTLKSNDENFSNDFVTAIEKKLLNKKPTHEQMAIILKGLLAIDSEKSAKLFWKLAWKTPAFEGELSLFNDALKESYDTDSRDENFPEALYQAARDLILEDKDIRFANVYLHFLNHTEGGSWNDEHIKTINLLSKIAPALADDPETQGVLKHTYLEAATLEFFVETTQLEKTGNWLDKADAIIAEPISWFSHLNNEEYQGAHQQDDFQSIKTLHKKKQLRQLSDWVEHEKKPEKPLADLPLDLYTLFTKSTPKSRIWHNPENGQALILGDEGSLDYFDGYSVTQPDQRQLKMARVVPGDIAGNESVNSSEDTPTLNSPIEQWIEYAIRSLIGSNDETPELDGRGIVNFANTAQPAQERLLFALLKKGELVSHPEYIEYVRHNQQIMLMADVDYEINQYLITLPDEATAIQWMQNLKDKAPLNTQPADLWYKATGSAENEEHGILLREYGHSDDDKEGIVITALHADADFDYNKHGCTGFRFDELEQFQAAINQRELALYKQGYVPERIYHDESCVEKLEEKLPEVEKTLEIL